MIMRERKIGWGPTYWSVVVLGMSSGVPFCSEVVTLSNTVDNSRNVAAYGTAHEKRMYGVCGPVQEMYVSCISGFPCRMYIDSNHCDSRI
jgi:hypothetical protein